jgi:hypothetical protein
LRSCARESGALPHDRLEIVQFERFDLSTVRRGVRIEFLAHAGRETARFATGATNDPEIAGRIGLDLQGDLFHDVLDDGSAIRHLGWCDGIRAREFALLIPVF